MSQVDARRAALLFCLKKLARRAMHSAELRHLLRERGLAEALVEEVLSECQRLGYLADRELIQSFVHRMCLAGKSRLAILAKAQARRLPLDEVQCELDQEKEQVVQYLRQFIAKRYPPLLQSSLSFGEKQKYMLRLRRRGFSTEQICQALVES
jgi:SOS response regulatory protein OraA/RecX